MRERGADQNDCDPHARPLHAILSEVRTPTQSQYANDVPATPTRDDVQQSATPAHETAAPNPRDAQVAFDVCWYALQQSVCPAQLPGVPADI
jgi:hypothetical protein